jgi:hypothetical protein
MMRISLGTFARTGIEAELGPDVAATVQAALCHYTGKVRGGRAPIAPPPFLLASSGGEPLELNVDPEVEETLRGEAARLGTNVESLAAHSVLVYLAELDFLRAPSRPV